MGLGNVITGVRRTLGNMIIPATPVSASNISGAGSNILVTTHSDAGVNVNEWTALSSTPVYAAITIISDTIGYCELPLYERTANGKNRREDHALSEVMAYPNDAMNGFDFRRTITSHALSWGNGYAYIERDEQFNIIALKPLLPDRTYPYRLSTGELVYVTRVNGTQVTLMPYEVLHVKAFSFNGLNGLSPIGLFRQQIGVNLAYEKFGAKLFANGANSNGILYHPGQLSKDAQDRLREQVNSKLTGLDNAHKTMILEEGMKFDKITINPNDAQWIESKQFSVEDIARIFRVPPHLIGHLERSTNNNIEQQTLDFKTHGLNPWATAWEQECNRKLLNPDERKALGFRFDFNNLVRADSQARANYYKSMSQYYSINEVREAEGVNRIETGDTILVPGGYMTLEGLIKQSQGDGEGDDTTDKPTDPTEPGQGTPTTATDTPASAPATQPRANAGPSGGNTGAGAGGAAAGDAVLDRRTRLDAQFRNLFAHAVTARCTADQLRQVLSPYIAAVRSMAADECGQALTDNPAFDAFTSEYCGYMAKRCQQDRGEGCSEDERISYEVRRCRNAVTRETYRALGVKAVRWADPTNTALHDRTVGIDEPFLNDTRKVLHPPIDHRCQGEIYPVTR